MDALSAPDHASIIVMVGIYQLGPELRHELAVGEDVELEAGTQLQ